MSESQSNTKTSVVVLVIFAVCAIGSLYTEGVFDDDDTVVPTFTSSDSAALATQLAEAYKAQGICYGWRMEGGDGSYYSSDSSVSTGSNFGAGRELDVDDMPAECDRALIFTADVVYTSASSESEDRATFAIEEYGIDLPSSVNQDLERFGVTEKYLLDDPVGTVARGVLALPLLAAEYGLAEPVPLSSPVGAAPSAAPAVGSDFLRDRGWLLITAVALIICAVVTLLLGVRSRRRAREREAALAQDAARHVSWQRHLHPPSGPQTPPSRKAEPQ